MRYCDTFERYDNQAMPRPKSESRALGIPTPRGILSNSLGTFDGAEGAAVVIVGPKTAVTKAAIDFVAF